MYNYFCNKVSNSFKKEFDSEPSAIKYFWKPKKNFMVMRLSTMLLKECIYIEKEKKVIIHITDDLENYSFLLGKKDLKK